MNEDIWEYWFVDALRGAVLIATRDKKYAMKYRLTLERRGNNVISNQFRILFSDSDNVRGIMMYTVVPSEIPYVGGKKYPKYYLTVVVEQGPEELYGVSILQMIHNRAHDYNHPLIEVGGIAKQTYSVSKLIRHPGYPLHLRFAVVDP